ncbi:MAG TPA: hypothetical protein PK668_18335 [Myxococcota bacterium]|nr:hypothetical protein [Myxococcota bacterium]HRY95923.1 hypothetical protein [Myxococcota bacterium]HSA23687.1 hypothetical protein [Myxococcota bacterium]
MHTAHIRPWRPIAAAALLLGSLACGGTQCDCVQPLGGPVPAEEQVLDAVQLRLTPQAFDFLEQNLPGLLASMLPGGLAFPVPPMHQEFDAWIFSLSLDICEAGCELQADIAGATLARVEPDRLHLTALANLTGLLTLGGDVECKVPIAIQQKPVEADVILRVDPRDGLLSFGVQGLTVAITDEDYELECYGMLGALVESLKGFLTQMMNEQISGQLDSALGGMLDQATCLACGFYTGGCPGGSACDGEYCLDGADVCLTNPLGLAGSLDVGALLASVVPGLSAELEVFLAAGQQAEPAVDPLVVADGLELRMIGAFDAERNRCVPEPDPAELPPVAPAPRLPFAADNLVPGSAVPFMLGVGVSDAFLDRALLKAYLGGALCLSLDSGLSDMLSSGTLAMLMGSLDTLTRGQNAPVRIALRPQGVPGLIVGLGTFTVDNLGNKIIDDPLLTIELPDVALDFYVRVDERWARVVTLTQDLRLLLGMDFLPDNRVLPVFDANSIEIGEVVASNYELLAEDPAALEQLLPTLLGLALPMLTESLGVIDIPEIQGFLLEILAVRGELAKLDGSAGFEHLALYANLGLVSAPPPAPRETRAWVREVRTPAWSAMSIHAPGGPAYPEVALDVGADRAGPAEYSWRLDGGGWSVFQPGPRLVVRSPVLALRGEHRIEVRARTAGAYRSLDPSPALVRVDIAPPRDLPVAADRPAGPSLDRLGQPGGELRVGEDAAAPGEPQAGCATGPGSGLALGLLALALLGLRRRA